MGGSAAGLMGMASAGTKLVGHFASALTLDPRYRRRRQLWQQQQAADTGQGFYMGLEALGDGICDGVTGFFEQPFRGAIDGGAAGFACGAVRGLVGAVAKPMSGLAGLASKTTEGIASDARSLAPGRRALQQQMQLRMRQPRVIGPGHVLLPYPRKLKSLDVSVQPKIAPRQTAEPSAAEGTGAHHSTSRHPSPQLRPVPEDPTAEQPLPVRSAAVCSPPRPRRPSLSPRSPRSSAPHSEGAFRLTAEEPAATSGARRAL